MKTTRAEKQKAIIKTLKKAGLEEIPKDPKTGKWITAGSAKKEVRRSVLNGRIFYNCPKCGKTLLFKKAIHTNKCIRCGQRLDWGKLEDMKSLYILADDSSEAAYWAEKYTECTGDHVLDVDIEKWRLELRGFPKLLFFPFLNDKDYGRFMRLASKDAKIVKER